MKRSQKAKGLNMRTQNSNAEIAHGANLRWTGRSTNYFLWTVQMLLTALFLFAGGVKLVLPIEAMTRETLLPGWFLRFIGIFEILGAAGLILPWLLGIKRILTPLAASGLVLIMSGATVITLENGGVAGAVMPFIVGILLSLVAYGRWAVLKPIPTNDRSGGFPAAVSSIG
jgi:DoxX-like protein